jgi:hypothetical protein
VAVSQIKLKLHVKLQGEFLEYSIACLPYSSLSFSNPVSDNKINDSLLRHTRHEGRDQVYNSYAWTGINFE